MHDGWSVMAGAHRCVAIPLPARVATVAKGVVGAVVAAGLWEVARATGLVDPVALPSLAETFRTALETLADGSLTSAIAATLRAWAAGLLVAVALAIPAGLAIGRSDQLARTTRPIMEFVRPIPSVAMIPVAIIVLGIGLQMKLALIAFASFWPVVFNSAAGAASVDVQYLDTARILGLSSTQRFLRIILVASLPAIATGIRVAASIALIVAITVEFVAGREGLGFFLETARLGGAVSRVWAAVLVSGVLGYLLSVAMTTVERRTLAWSGEHRRA